jgi:pimeloyl-ACP methyl ester carboxylesterase
MPFRPFRILRYLLLIAFAIIVIVAFAGILYQHIGNASDAKRFPIEGRLVPLGPDVPNVSLAINCTGQGSPTVILDSGLGVPGIAGWKQSQPDIAKFTRVCSYDRAGYGWSTPGPMPRTSAQIVKELHALLTAAGEKPPYVLVAHSFGGFNVRLYTADYPDEVAGLVFVDTSHPDQLKRMSDPLRKSITAQYAEVEKQAKLIPYLRFFGVARYTNKIDPTSKVSTELQEEVRYLQLQQKFIDASTSEIMYFEPSGDEVRAKSTTLGSRPLFVLTAGKDPQQTDLPPGVVLKDMQDFHKMWVEQLQLELAHLSTVGTQQVVPDSTHMIPFERPDTVVAATQKVVEAVRAQSTTPAPPPPAPTKSTKIATNQN